MSLLFIGGISGQTIKDDGKVEVVTCEHFTISKPLRELFEENNPSANFIERDGYKESKDRQNRKPQTFIEQNEVDPVVQEFVGTYSPKALVNWAGQSDGSCPPDPTGAVGTNYYVQAVNATPFKVFNKTTGVQVGTVRQLGNLWSPAVSNDGDPIVLYDKFADRWFIAQFKFSGSYKIYIAISQTNDPTGSYYCYTFSSSQMPDFGKFSIWQDGYYMTSNQSTQKIVIFEREQMLLGNSSSRSITKNFTAAPPTGGGFFCPLPADADGQLPVAGTPCPVFTYQDSDWGTGLTDGINVYNVTTTWGTTPAATITGPTFLATDAFNSTYSSSWLDIPQPGTSQKLDGIGGVFNFRAQYRIWTGYNTVVLCMGVKVSSTQRGIRWYELRQTGGTWSVYQQGTYSPSDGLYRWCGSIAMNDEGSIGLGYAVSGTMTVSPNSNVYPSIRYTGRRAADALGVMSYTETTAMAGVAAMTSSCGERFGDYSHTSVDPSDGVTFWCTSEYVGTSGTPATRIFSFQIPLYVGIEEEQARSKPEVSVYKSNFDLNIKAVNLPSDNEMVVDLFDINGKKISGKTITPVSKSFETSFNVFGLAAGAYLVRVGEPNQSFQKVTKVIID